MDFSIIDELYNIYRDYDIVEAEEMFNLYYSKYQMYGSKNLISIINEYIKQHSAYVGNYYVSEKDEAYAEHKLIENIVSLFESVIMPVDDLIDKFVYDELDEEAKKDNDNPIKMRKPHDLFNIDIKFIEEAVHKDDDTYLVEFNQIKDLLIYVKKHKILDKIYKDDSWYELNFSEVIYSIYDYIDNKAIFKIDEAEHPERDEFLFERIKANCARKLKGNFDKFRPNLNSNKQMRTDFGKLIFCKNLLMFYQTEILPDYNGFVDFSVDYIKHIELIDDFKNLYSKKFNKEIFRENQGNFICNPEVYNSANFTVEAGKKVKKDNSLIFGYLISCEDDLHYTKYDYLIHIEIADVNNPISNYEMQLNIIPRGELNQRLQLIRLDNWESDQPHKNIAKKLSTRTHIHLYNEFDVLRGKTNGAFDIAYNIEGTETEFSSALTTFLNIIDLGEDVTEKIYRTTIKGINSEKVSDSKKEI